MSTLRNIYLFMNTYSNKRYLQLVEITDHLPAELSHQKREKSNTDKSEGHAHLRQRRVRLRLPILNDASQQKH